MSVLKMPCPKCQAPYPVVRSRRGKEPVRIVAVLCDACGVQETNEERVARLAREIERSTTR